MIELKLKLAKGWTKFLLNSINLNRVRPKYHSSIEINFFTLIMFLSILFVLGNYLNDQLNEVGIHGDNLNYILKIRVLNISFGKNGKLLIQVILQDNCQSTQQNMETTIVKATRLNIKAGGNSLEHSMI